MTNIESESKPNLRMFYNKKGALEAILDSLDTCKSRNNVSIRILSTRKKIVFFEDFPDDLVKALRFTSIEDNIRHDANLIPLDEIFKKLDREQTKEFFNVILDSHPYIWIRVDKENIFFKDIRP